MAKFHGSISFRGNLRKTDKELWDDWSDSITIDGQKPKNGSEIRDIFMEQLSNGCEKIPFGQECDNFDKEKGCLGHNS